MENFAGSRSTQESDTVGTVEDQWLPTLPPKPSTLLSRLSFVAPELVQVLKRKPGIRKPIPLLDDLCMEERAIS